jgi:hypothetical protein
MGRVLHRRRIRLGLCMLQMMLDSRRSESSLALHFINDSFLFFNKVVSQLRECPTSV